MLLLGVFYVGFQLPFAECTQRCIGELFVRDGTVDAEFELTGVYTLTPADFGGIVDRSEGPPPPPPPPPEEVDWNALAAQVLANFAATGQWFV